MNEGGFHTALADYINRVDEFRMNSTDKVKLTFV